MGKVKDEDIQRVKRISNNYSQSFVLGRGSLVSISKSDFLFLCKKARIGCFKRKRDINYFSRRNKMEQLIIEIEVDPYFSSKELLEIVRKKLDEISASHIGHSPIKKIGDIEMTKTIALSIGY